MWNRESRSRRVILKPLSDLREVFAFLGHSERRISVDRDWRRRNGESTRFDVVSISWYDFSFIDSFEGEIFWPEIFGPRIQEYFKYASLALLEDFEDKPSFLDITRMFTDDAFREEKLSKVTNPIVIDKFTCK